MKHCWTISHAKKYYQRLKKSAISAKSSLPLISRLNIDIVTTLANKCLVK